MKGIPTVMMRVITTHLCTARIRSCPVHWKPVPQELGDGGNREQGHTDYYTAISRIRSYLEKNLTYSTAADPYTGQGDFAEDFLTNTRIGHSVHYATAAALMFRYYGIPSRYVEGYLITPEDIKDKNPGDTIEVPGKNGHAWTEIYMDGLG